MLIKYWLALLDETNDMHVAKVIERCFYGAQNAVHRAWWLVHFLDVFASLQICAVIKNHSSWNAAWDIKKRRSNHCLWNRWIQRRQEGLSQRLTVEQACLECSTQPWPFCVDYLLCGFSVVASSLVQIMDRRFPVRLNRVFPHQQALHRLPLPSIQVIPNRCK